MKLLKTNVINRAKNVAKLSAMIFVLGFMFAGTATSQEVGIRFGDIVGNDVAVDFVWGGKSSRMHADVSFGDGVGVELLFDFINRPLGGESFNYYLGIGPFAWLGDPFKLGAVGEIGLEYRFKGVPIVIGADWRPSFRIIKDTHFFADRFGLNIRWLF